MTAIAVFNEKGGSGKTLLTVHLAVAAHQAGRKVAILDLDPQASASAWSEARGETPGPVVVKVPISSLDRAVAGAKADGFDFILIDSPPGVTPMAARIVSAADLVLVPVRPQKFDMDAVPATVKLIGAKPYVFVQSDCPQRAPEIEKRRKELETYKRPIFGPVHNWRSFWRALETGEAVIEFEPDGQPAAEIQSVYQSIIKELS
jgi:chromosome partitioning protein